MNNGIGLLTMMEKSEILEKRQKKVDGLRKKINLFPNHFKVQNTVGEIQEKIGHLGSDVAGDDRPETSSVIREFEKEIFDIYYF